VEILNKNQFLTQIWRFQLISLDGKWKNWIRFSSWLKYVVVSSWFHCMGSRKSISESVFDSNMMFPADFTGWEVEILNQNQFLTQICCFQQISLDGKWKYWLRISFWLKYDVSSWFHWMGSGKTESESVFDSNMMFPADFPGWEVEIRNQNQFLTQVCCFQLISLDGK
jgi:hypothetical protein